jgi:hypothetical protein
MSRGGVLKIICSKEEFKNGTGKISANAEDVQQQ